MYLPLLQAIDHLGNMPGDASVRVHYHPLSSGFFIEDGESEEVVPPDTQLICAGQPQKFFNYLDSILKQDYWDNRKAQQ